MRLCLSCIVFVLVLALLAGVQAVINTWQRKKKQSRLQALLQAAQAAPDALTGLDSAPRKQSAAVRLFGRTLDLARLETLLTSADVSIAPKRFLTLAMTLGLLGFVIIWIITQHVLGAMVVMAAGACLPLMVLLIRRQRRDAALVRQMPDALDMIVRALRVGQSVDNALRDVGRNCPPPLGAEIQGIYEEMALGIPFSAALRNFEARFARLADVKLMTTAFIIQRETGGNLTRVLSNLSDLIRQRDSLKRQIKALTAEGRSSAVILGLLPLAVGTFFWIIRPGYIQTLFSHPTGRKMLLAAILLEIGGFVVMRLMTRIEP
jgi:tight adherence protein B